MHPKTLVSTVGAVVLTAGIGGLAGRPAESTWFAFGVGPQQFDAVQPGRLRCLPRGEGKKGEFDAGHFVALGSARALAGDSARPLASSVFDQRAMRSKVSG